MLIDDKTISEKLEFDELFYEQLSKDQQQPIEIRMAAQEAITGILKVRVFFLQKEQGLQLKLR